MNNTGEKELRILLIEDDYDDALYLEELLRSTGRLNFELIHCVRLAEGISAYKEGEFDVVLLDLNLPDSFGIETVKLITENILEAPIIVLTGIHDTQKAIDALSLGVQDYWVKGETKAEILLDSLQFAISRKNVEENLRKNHKLLLSIFNEVPTSLVLVNDKREVLKINDSGLKLAGDQEKNIIGLRAGNALRCINALTNPKGCGESEACVNCMLKNTIERSFQTKETFRDIEATLPHKQNGSVLNHEIIFSTSYIHTEQEPYVQVSITDVTQLKAYQHQVERSNQRLESLLKLSQYIPKNEQDLLDYALKIAIDLCESKIGYIYYYNEKTEKFVLNSWSKEVMKECQVFGAQTEYNLNDTGCWGEAVRQRKPIIINNYHHNHDLAKGTPKGHVQLHKFLTIPVFHNEEIVAVVGVANKETDYDQTDVKQLTLLMDAVWKKVDQERNKKELIAAKERAEESDRLKSAFLATMSHELRTPLNSVIGFSELLLGEENQEIINEFAKHINTSGNHLLEIIEEIFSISELESSDAKLTKELFSIEDMFKAIKVEASKFDVSKKTGISLQCKINEELKHVFVFADKSKIKQVFFHLIGNAIKFTLKGEVVYGATFVNNTPAFYVRDSGIGIAIEHKDHIFQRFTQIEQTLTREFEGIGLGLNICKRIVDLFGGKIWFESKLGVGTTFYFTFPDLIINVLTPIDVNDPFLKL